MCQISIVLPVYNGEKHIKKSLDSILQQTFEEFELIIVNDSSTDNSRKIVEEYACHDKRIKVINNENNLKLPASLNIGFQNAKGKYLTWTSHDNAFMPEALKIMYDVLETNVEYGMVYCDYYIIDEAGNKVKEEKIKMSEPASLLWGNVIGACFLYRREVAEKVGDYDLNMFLAEDYDYWLRVYKEAKIRHIEEPLYLYRCHNQSLTETRKNDVKSQTAKVWIKHLDFITKKMSTIKKLGQFYDQICEYAGDEEREKVKKDLLQYKFKYRVYNMMKKVGI